MFTTTPDSPPKLNGSGAHHATPPDATSILLDRMFRVDDSLTDIKVMLSNHGERLCRIEAQVQSMPAVAKRGREWVRTWALGLVPKTYTEASAATLTVGGAMELWTGWFGVVDKLTTIGVAAVKSAAGM